MVGRGPKGPSRGGVPGQSVDIVTTKIGSPLMGMSPSIRLLDAKRTGCSHESNQDMAMEIERRRRPMRRDGDDES